jgi:hypothetical protein
MGRVPMNLTALLVIIVVNVPLYLLLGKAFFGSWEGFLTACIAVVQPDIISAATGNFEENRIGRFTLLIYLLVCVACVAAEYHVVAKFILGIANPWG